MTTINLSTYDTGNDNDGTKTDRLYFLPSKQAWIYIFGTGTYTFTGDMDNDGNVIPSSNFQKIEFYMNRTANTVLNCGGAMFNVPVYFFTNALSENSNASGTGRTLTLLGSIQFLNTSTFHTGAKATRSNSVINFGNSDNYCTFTGANNSTTTPYPSGSSVTSFTGGGFVKLNNSNTVLNIYLAKDMIGIHNGLSITNLIINDGANIYGIVKDIYFPLSAGYVFSYDSYFESSIPLKLKFTNDITISIQDVPTDVNIIIAAENVIFYNSVFFGNFNVTITEGAMLTVMGCTFNDYLKSPTGTNITTVPLNIYGNGTFTLYNGLYTISNDPNDELRETFVNTINAVLGKKIINAPNSTIICTEKNNVNIPAGYVFTDTITSIQNNNFVFEDAGTYTFGSFESYPLTVTFPGSNLTANVSVTASKGANVIFPGVEFPTTMILNDAEPIDHNNNTIVFSTSSNFYSSELNNNSALLITSNGSGTEGIVNFGTDSGIYAGIYAYDGGSLIVGSNTKPLNNYKLYLFGDNTKSGGEANSGSWTFNHSIYSGTGDYDIFSDHAVHLTATNISSASTATYNVTLDCIALTLYSSISTSGNIYINGIVTHGQLIVNTSATIPILGGTFNDSCSYDEPLYIYDCGHFKANDLNIYITHTGTWPYFGNLDGDTLPNVYLSHACYNFDSGEDRNIAFYDANLYLVDNGFVNDAVVTGNKYDIHNINLQQLNLFAQDNIIPYVKLCSTQKINFNMTSSSYYIIANCSMLSNSGSESDTIFELYGNDSQALNFYGTVNINVYHSKITCATLDGNVITNQDNAYINYYYDTYNFSCVSHWLEYTNGIILKSPCSDGTYTFNNVNDDLTIYVNDDIDPKITESTFCHYLTLSNASSHSLKLENCIFNIHNDSQIRLLNTGRYNFICSCLFNIRTNVCSPVHMCGCCSLSYTSVSYDTTGGYTYQFVVKSITTDGSTIDFHDNIFSAEQVEVYWTSLCSVISNVPFRSGSNAYFATDYNPADTLSLTHNHCGYKNTNNELITNISVIVASGKVDSTATVLEGSLSSIFYSCFDEQNYTGKLNQLFNDSNVYDYEYFGGLDGSQTQNINVDSSTNTKTTYEINFSTDYCTYVGNAIMQLSYNPDDISYGTPPPFKYSILENSCPPTLTTITDSITINGRSCVVKLIRMRLSKGIGLPIYAFPYFGSDDSTLDIASLFTYAKRTNMSNYYSYSDYLDNAHQEDVQYFNPGEKCIHLKIKYNYDLHTTYKVGDSMKVDLELLADHSLSPIFESNGVLVTNQQDFSYPLISENYDSISDLQPTSEMYPLNLSDTGALASLIDDTFTYNKVYYFSMLTDTFNGGYHSLLISKQTENFTYSYEQYTNDGLSPYRDGVSLTDNGNGTAILTIPNRDYNSYGVKITVTTNDPLDSYDFGSKEENFKFNVVDQSKLLGPRSSMIDSTPSYDETDFSFPVAFSVSTDGTTYYSSGHLDITFDKGNNVIIYVKTAGTVPDGDEVVCNFLVSNSDASEVFSRCNDSDNITSFNIHVCGNNTIGHKTFYFYDNSYISGNATITCTPNTISNNSGPLGVFSSIDNIVFTDNSMNHILTFYSGLGSEVELSSTVNTNSDFTQKPTSFSHSTPATLGSRTADLASNIYVTFNSIPYNITNQTDYTIKINYSLRGKVNSGDDWSDLVSGTDYYTYLNTQFNSTTDNIVTINRDTYSHGDAVKYFVMADNSTIKYIQILYYATDGNGSGVSSDCDYKHLPNGENKAVIASYDYSSADTGTLTCRIMSLGNWQFRSDPAGNLIMSYRGSTTGENFTTKQYKLYVPIEEDTIGDVCFKWNGNTDCIPPN